MKVLAARINWMLDWSNSPELEILVDKIPASEDLRYERRDNLYVAEDAGYVSFYYWKGPGNTSGFGGAAIPVTMKDGSTVELLGPWSSRAGCVNQLWPEHPVVDVALTSDPDTFYKGRGCFFAGHITLELAQQAAALIGEKLERRRDDSEPVWIPAGKELQKKLSKGSR